MTKRYSNNILGKIGQPSKLYSPSSFLIGMGSILNIVGSYFDYNYSKLEMETDNEALKRDWETIGKDINKSLIAVHE